VGLRGEGVVETTSSLVETSSSSPPTRAGSTAGRWSPPSPPRGRRGSPASPSPSPPSPTGSTARRTTWRWTSGCRSTWPTQGQRARASPWLSPPSRSPVPAGICSTDSAGIQRSVSARSSFATAESTVPGPTAIQQMRFIARARRRNLNRPPGR